MIKQHGNDSIISCWSLEPSKIEPKSQLGLYNFTASFYGKRLGRDAAPLSTLPLNYGAPVDHYCYTF